MFGWLLAACLTGCAVGVNFTRYDEHMCYHPTWKRHWLEGKETICAAGYRAPRGDGRGGDPYLSVVVAVRNDNYEGNYRDRLAYSLKGSMYNLAKHNVAAEFILVEWNPDPKEPPMFETAKSWGLPNFIPVRIITVPASLHDSLKIDHKKSPKVLEYHAKNVGIRRAKGEFILTANSDSVMSEGFGPFFAKRGLDKDFFYRSPLRRTLHHADPNHTPEEAAAHANNLCDVEARVHQVPHLADYQLCLTGMLRDPASIPLHHEMYTLASGDFIMAHRSAWERAEGFLQVGHNAHCDSIMLYRFMAAGIRQAVLAHPCYLFHVHQPRDSYQEAYVEPGFPDYGSVCGMMMSKTWRGWPSENGGKTWGYSDMNFEENVLFP